MAREVSRYGIHWAPGNVAFLHQTRGGVNAWGMKERSPFFVRTPNRRWVCSHLIALAATNPAGPQMAKFRELIEKNSLVRFMLPLPKGADIDTKVGVGYVTTKQLDGDMLDIAMLCKMASPVQLPIFWMNLHSPKTLLMELTLTDVQPMVVAGVKAQHLSQLNEVLQAASIAPRRLLLVCDDDVPMKVTQLDAAHMMSQDQTDLVALPWESLGGMVLRGYMRHEWERTWFSREPIPGNESKGEKRDTPNPNKPAAPSPLSDC